MTVNADPPDAHSAPVDPDHDLAHLDRSHQPWFARLGRFSARRRRPVMIVWLLVAVLAAPLALTVGNALSGAGWEAGGSTSVEVRDELRADFPLGGDLGLESLVSEVVCTTFLADHDAAVVAPSPDVDVSGCGAEFCVAAGAAVVVAEID